MDHSYEKRNLKIIHAVIIILITEVFSQKLLNVLRKSHLSLFRNCRFSFNKKKLDEMNIRMFVYYYCFIFSTVYFFDS